MAPILISFSRSVVSDQCSTSFGKASVRMKRGNGMIVTFPKGRGEVFHAGTCEWVAGLIESDPFVERITPNVLDRFLA